MKKQTLVKTISLLLLSTMVVAVSFPAPARAQSAGGIATGVGGQLASCLLGGILSSVNMGSLLGKMGLGSGGSMPGASGGGSNAIPVDVVGSHLDQTNQIRSSQDWQKQKECTLDGLAWTIAGEFLQGMSESVVDWINSGFDGNPSFIENPDAYFLSQADQITGEFLANAGPLAGLCDGFGLDIRLSLAMSQTQKLRTRYACTLSTIINNAQNAHFNVSVDSSPNGATLGSIMNGDVLNNANGLSINGNSVNSVTGLVSNSFEKGGGWGGFIAMTTIPQNNPIGAYLMARSDLQTSIASAREESNNDLNRGGGFFSWKKCETVNGKNTCSIQTPGSVISNALNKQLDASVERLNVADELNEVIEALFRQLVKTVLRDGLHTVSIKQPGQTQSVMNQLSAQSTASANAQTSATLAEMKNSISTYLNPTKDYKYFKEQTLTIVRNEQTYVTSVSNECANSGSRNQTAIDDLRTLLYGTIAPVVNQAQTDVTNATTKLTAVQNLQTAIDSGNIQNATSLYSQVIGSNYLVSANEVKAAYDTMDQATKAAKEWHDKANQYGLRCGLSNSSGGTSM